MTIQSFLKGTAALLIIVLAGCGGGKEPSSSPTVKSESSTKSTAASSKSSSSKSSSNKTIYISNTIPYKKGLRVPAAVRAECNLEQSLSHYIDLEAEEIDIDVEVTSNLKKARGKVLKIEIIDILASGGGAYSGPKSVTLKGTLKDKGKVIGTFTARRYSGGGFWGGFKGTCSILDRDARVLGEDVAGWLANPYKGARLGDAH